MPGKVLITDGLLRKSLAVTRSLGKRGVSTLCGETTKFNLCAFSRYCTRRFIYPSPAKRKDAFSRRIASVLRNNPGTVFFPMDDDVLQAVYENMDELKKICTIPVANYESYVKADDKGVSANIAIKSGADCPQTYMPQDAGDAKSYADSTGYPVVIKPRRSSGSRGIRIAHNSDELVCFYNEVSSRYHLPVIQEYVHTGERYDVCLFYDRYGVLKASFVQKELRHFPVDIGPSTVQESVVMPELVKQAVGIMDSIPWRGVVEIEFMKDKKDGKTKFMEINPRFWNSLYLSVLCGIDFPWMLYRDAIGEDVEACHDYAEGIKCRWLLPGDILHFLFSKKRGQMDPAFLKGKRHNVHDDILSMEDPFPSAGFLLSCFRFLFDLNMWRFMFRR